MAFDVVFVDSVGDASPVGRKETKGRIQIGSLEESFFAVLTVWSMRKYMLQWIDAVERIERGGDKSAIITCLQSPQGEVLGFWWVLYRMPGNQFAVQEQLILRDVVGDSFLPSRYYDFIQPHETTSDDGSPISEWYTTLAELSEFKQRVTERLPGAAL